MMECHWTGEWGLLGPHLLEQDCIRERESGDLTPLQEVSYSLLESLLPSSTGKRFAGIGPVM